ncbi:hypothetical protein [Spirosoma sp.]|uniref:hypothetical protein n=1 Tax=Spirosoma sp. TaxID=1899569 RepID=UPI0026376799|nr:hypothetical protein [Spirosoma sp.]MCX6217289.1 hypothetical protein [Spirosoma sp.]
MKLSTVQPALPDIHAIADSNKTYRRYFLVICLLYLVIAAVLAVLVRWGVMDEDFHLESSLPFAKSGVNSTTLYNHVPPTGVSSHIWFAAWVWLFPGITYVGLRLITCAFLVVLVAWTYTHMKTLSTDSQRKVLAATLFMLAFPYFFLSVSTVMTEGPSMLYLIAGLLLLSISRLQRLLPFFLGCLFLGLTTISRFYYIPLLPALAVVLFVADWKDFIKTGTKSISTNKVLMYLAIAVSLLPLVGLIILWGGMTPPAFHQWSKLRSGISFNAFRPVSSLALVGIYSAPAVLVNVNWGSKGIRSIMLISLGLALVLALFNVNLFHDSSSVNDVFSGPIEHTLAWFTARGNLAQSLGMFGIYGLSFFSLAIVGEKVVQYIRQQDFSDGGLVFSIVFVVFFIASQAFVGGNHPFFDRYLAHPWPFMGYILVCLFPRFLNSRTYLVLAAYTVLSVMILVKWGIHQESLGFIGASSLGAVMDSETGTGRKTGTGRRSVG